MRTKKVAAVAAVAAAQGVVLTACQSPSPEAESAVPRQVTAYLSGDPSVCDAWANAAVCREVASAARGLEVDGPSTIVRQEKTSDGTALLLLKQPLQGKPDAYFGLAVKDGKVQQLTAMSGPDDGRFWKGWTK